MLVVKRDGKGQYGGINACMDAWMDGWMIEQDQGFIMNHSEHNITYLTVVEVAFLVADEYMSIKLNSTKSRWVTTGASARDLFDVAQEFRAGFATNCCIRYLPNIGGCVSVPVP